MKSTSVMLPDAGIRDASGKDPSKDLVQSLITLMEMHRPQTRESGVRTFQMHSSVALSTFTLLCKYHHYPSPELTLHPKLKLILQFYTLVCACCVPAMSQTLHTY